MSKVNLNMLTKRKQIATLIGVIIAGSVTAGVVYLTAGDGKPVPQAVKPKVVPPSGVVTNAFTEQVQRSALHQQQERTSALRKQVSDLTKQLSSTPASESADGLALKTTV